MPQNWKTYKLSEVFQIIGGGTPKTTVEEYWNGDIPWLSVVDFNNDQRTVTETEKTITQLGLEKSSTKLLKKGQLIISARGTVGQLAQLGRDMTFNQSCYGLDGIESKLSNDFGYYLLKHSVSNIQSNAHGSVFDTITRNTFDNIETQIPESLPEQQAIASILSSLDDKIELNLQMNKTLEEMAMTLYKHWFVDFGPFKDGAFVESELGLIPDGWEVKRLGDLAVFKNGKGLKSESKIDTGEFDVFGSNGVIGRTDQVMFASPVVAIGRVGANYGEVHYSIKPCWISDNAVTVQPTNQESFWWLLQTLRLIDYSNFVAGSAQPLITQGAIKEVKSAVPNEEELKVFSKRLDSLFNQINSNIFENQTLTNLRDTLLPKLISGEVRVKDAEQTLAEVL